MFEEFPALTREDTEPLNSTSVVQWMFARCDQVRLQELDLRLNGFIRWVKVAYKCNRTGRTFFPHGSVKGALTTVFCAIPLPSMGTREEFKNDRLSAWHHYSARCELVDVDGEHYTMLSETHVDSFAEKLRKAMAQAEKDITINSMSKSPVSPRRHHKWLTICEPIVV
jgi:thioesterase domain-containing protein